VPETLRRGTVAPPIACLIPWRCSRPQAYAFTRAAASLGVLDIVGIGPSDVVLVQTKSNEWSRAVEMEAIRNFPCPFICKKLIHRWRDRIRLPDVRVVE